MLHIYMHKIKQVDLHLSDPLYTKAGCMCPSDYVSVPKLCSRSRPLFYFHSMSFMHAAHIPHEILQTDKFYMHSIAEKEVALPHVLYATRFLLDGNDHDVQEWACWLTPTLGGSGW